MKKPISFFCLLLILCMTPFSVTDSDCSAYADSGKYAVCLQYAYLRSDAIGCIMRYTVTYSQDYYDFRTKMVNGAAESMKETFSDSGWTVRTEENGIIVLETVYDTLEEYAIDIGYDGFSVDKTPSTGVEKKTFFFTETTYTAETVFAGLYDEMKIVGRVYDICCKRLGIADEKIKLEYVYGSPYRKKTLTSNGTVGKDTDTGLVTHTFVIPTDNLHAQAVLCLRNPNASAWYLVAVAIGLFVVAAITIPVVIKKRRNY